MKVDENGNHILSTGKLLHTPLGIIGIGSVWSDNGTLSLSDGQNGCTAGWDGEPLTLAERHELALYMERRWHAWAVLQTAGPA